MSEIEYIEQILATAGHEDSYDREVHRDSAIERTIQLNRKFRHIRMVVQLVLGSISSNGN